MNTNNTHSTINDKLMEYEQLSCFPSEEWSHALMQRLERTPRRRAATSLPITLALVCAVLLNAGIIFEILHHDTQTPPTRSDELQTVARELLVNQ